MANVDRTPHLTRVHRSSVLRVPEHAIHNRVVDILNVEMKPEQAKVIRPDAGRCHRNSSLYEMSIARSRVYPGRDPTPGRVPKIRILVRARESRTRTYSSSGISASFTVCSRSLR